MEIPDMRLRMGINDSAVLGGSMGLNWARLRAQIAETIATIREGLFFFIRGFRRASALP